MMKRLFSKQLFQLLVCSLLVIPVWGQKANITGVVKDVKNEPIPMASILITGTTIGTITDLDGKYKIANVEPGKYTITVSYIGFATEKQSVELNGKDIELNFTMKEDALRLNEAVVIGYGSSMKRDVTGSISSIKPKEMTQVIVPSFDQAIQGRASGVQVTAANGVAGAPVKINVRGTNSIMAGSEPLYVVDGIPITTGDYSPGSLGSGTNALSDINPNDIESIDILKDAAATAIYGSRGANGVVMISTKKGQAGKTKFTVGYMAGIVQETNRLKFISAEEQLELRDKQRMGDNELPEDSASIVYTSTNGNELTRWQADSIAALGGTDWVDKVLRIGNVQEANLTASGGNEKTLFYMGGTYRKEKGFLVGNDYQRVSGRLNIENKATDNLKLGVNIGLTYSDNDRVPIGDAGGLGQAQQMLPYIPIYKSDGTYFEPYNPIWALENNTFNAKGYRTIANVFGDYQILPGLSFRTEFGLDLFNQIEKEFNFRNILDTSSISTAWDRRTNVTNWTTNNYFTYAKKINKIHDVSFTLGTSLQKSKSEYVGLRGVNFSHDFFTNPGSVDDAYQDGYGYESANSFTSYFTRLNYKLKERYLLGLSLRCDASSRFSPAFRYGWFPAISGGWIINEEKFMESLSFISYLKLRASYGVTGNAEIGDFTRFGFFSPTGGYNGENGMIPTSLPNDSLRWEKSLQLDINLDFGFFNNRITGSVSYYDKNSKDLLLPITLPTSSGYSIIVKNIGKINNHGIEVALNTKNLSGKFKWTTDFNFSSNKNTVLDAAGLPPDAFESGQPGEGRVIVRYPVGQTYALRYAGVQKQDGNINTYDLSGNITGDTMVTAGTALYYDLNGNIMTASCPTGGADPYQFNRVPVGKPTPDFFGGITNTISYKGVELSFMFSYVYGNTLYDDPGKRQIGDYTKIAQREEIENAWSTSNPNSNVPKLETPDTYKLVNSDRFLYDASFLRLRFVTLAYNFPENLCKKFHLNSLRIYANGTNLWLLTNYPGWDPEVLRNVDTNSQQGNISFAGPSFQTPQAKVISIGISTSF